MVAIVLTISLSIASEILEGYGRISTIPPNVKYVEKFQEAETKAKEANRGLWSLE